MIDTTDMIVINDAGDVMPVPTVTLGCFIFEHQAPLIIGHAM